MTQSLQEVQKAFTDEIRYVDDTAQIVLKGHLVAENLMNSALESFVFHSEHLNNARLQFSQKLELCRSISLSENQNNMWNLISKINKVRNHLAHSLEAEKRQSAIQSLSSIYDQEFGAESRNIEGMSEEAALCMQAISGALGFLHTFNAEIKRFEEVVRSLDSIMNKGSLSR